MIIRQTPATSTSVSNFPGTQPVSGTITISPSDFSTRSDTYTVTGDGVTLDLSTKPCSKFSIACKGTGGALGAWTIPLQGSLDGTNWTTLATHNLGVGDGIVLPTTVLMPMLYIRSSATLVTLGIGPTNIVATILAMK